MNPNVYRWCAVPQCNNTSIKTPNKLFINVPKMKNVRNTWLNLARRDPAAISNNSVVYFCEDHFDLPNDMENYVQYQVMGSVSQIRMKSGCIPTRFECQPDRRKRTYHTTERPYVLKKQRKLLIEESVKYNMEQTTPKDHSEIASTSESSVLPSVEEIQEAPITHPKLADKAIQVLISYKFRSKAVQTQIKLVHQLTSPMKPDRSSVSTSPFKITSCGSSKPGTSSLFNTSRRVFTIEDQSDSDVSYTPSVPRRETSPSTQSLQMQSSSDCSELIEQKKKEETSNILKYTLVKIMKYPRSYLGLNKSCYYLLEIIEEETKIPLNNILLCLKKIRLNNSFIELGIDFGMSTTYASKIFFKNIPIIASVMQPFIVTLNSDLTKRTLPRAFRHQFSHTSCIIDCLEIQMQKPSKAVYQAISWSEYKKGNTLKYLISCTPNGLVNYISAGYGGRVTDTSIVEACNFVDFLQPGMSVMADRGFKHVEQYLRLKKVQLVRPPSVITGAKLSKSEAKETKQIASLRIHIERVIRRLREFHMLKPHACLNLNFIKVLDDIIVIACAFINLQDSLMK